MPHLDFTMYDHLPSLLFQLSQTRQTLVATKTLHALIIRSYLSHDPFYATRTIRFYALNHDLHSSRNLFNKTPNRTVYLWNSMIRAYAQHHQFKDAFSLFAQMRSSESKPDSHTFACISLASMDNYDALALRTTHGGVITMGLGSDSVTSSAVLMAYSKLGLLEEACKVFSRVPEPDLVLWNSMITGYGSVGLLEKGLEMLCKMRNTGKNPDGYTFVGLLSGFVDSCLLEVGQGIHGFCLKAGHDLNPHVQSSLVSMYSRCNCVHFAYSMFDSVSYPDLVQWSALITGLSQSGECKEALLLFKQMNDKGEKSDVVLIASVLAACARLATLKPGREIHGYVLRNGLQSHVMVVCALIDMYFKCGFSEFGVQVLKNTTKRSTAVFNSIILGFGSHGLKSQAFEMFEEMLINGLKPDQATFSSLLCACVHSGAVTDGKELFRRMKEEFGIAGRTEHYVHMVKLLGTVGELEEAYNLIQSMSVPLDSGVLGALLSSCVIHGNSELGEIVAHQLSEIEPDKTAYCVMLSNIYASNGNWSDVKNLRENMIREGMQKIPGTSWV